MKLDRKMKENKSMKHILTLLTALLLGSSPHLDAAESQRLDALGNTGWFQGMWPTDASMPTPSFPRFQIETTNNSIVVARKFPMDPVLEAKEPVVRLTLAGQTADWQIVYRFGNLLRLKSDAISIEMVIVSHRLVLFRVRQPGKALGALQAEGVELIAGKSVDETLAVAAYDDAMRVEGRAQALLFDELWVKLARPQDIEPFLTGSETQVERNLIAACVNRVLRNARGGGFIHEASMLEFFGPEWHTANAVWICFQPACRYALWIEPSFWANSMRTLLYRQTSDGRVPQAVYVNSDFKNSQIPNISPCLRDYYVFTHDSAFLADSYPRFKRWYKWWLAERNPTGDGIIAVGASKQDLWTAICEYKDNGTDPNDSVKFENTCNPLTRTPEIAGRPDRVYLPDIVACQARMAEDLAFMAGELGLQGDVSHFVAEYRRVRDWANKNLWDEQTKFYYPVVRATGKKLMKRSNVAFWLLWAGIPDERQKTALVDAMFDPKQFFTKIPLPMIALSDPTFNAKCGHWGDGYVWPIDVFHAFDGLLRYGEWDNAAKLVEQFNRGVFVAIQDSFRPNEYYHHSGRTAGNPIMGTAGCLPLTFQRYLKDYKAGKAQAEWARFAPAPLVALQAADSKPSVELRDDAAWICGKGTLIFHDAFDREETGNLARATGNGWNSATADRVPHIKQADLDGGILKIVSATKEAGHAAHIHHEAGFTDGGVVVRFKFPGLNKGESLQLGFVDRETKGIHAGHLCYAILSSGSITLIDHKTGVMNLEIRKRRQEYLDRKEKLPADLDELLKTKQITVSWKADHEWHDLVLVTEGDEMRLSLDGKVIAHHRSEGFAHPMKCWFSFLVPNTVWIDDVKIWKIK